MENWHCVDMFLDPGEVWADREQISETHCLFSLQFASNWSEPPNIFVRSIAFLDKNHILPPDNS